MAELTPQTREEHFLARIAGDPNALVLEPVTRIEHFLQKIIDNGGPSPGPGGGMTDAVKQAFLNAFSHVAWTDEHGQDYYDALEAALYPPADLVSISAVYTQSGTVYNTDNLDSLKSDLIVTALYADTTTATITNYTLSGTLTVGTSTITVSYRGKTATFDVTVSAIPYICELTGADFEYETRLLDTPPYYGASTAGYPRTAYVKFDIPVSAGKVKFTLVHDWNKQVKFGTQTISADGYTKVQNEQNITSANKYDPGYLHSGDTITIPETFADGSAPAFMRITLTDESGTYAVPVVNIITFKAEAVEA